MVQRNIKNKKGKSEQKENNINRKGNFIPDKSEVKQHQR